MLDHHSVDVKRKGERVREGEGEVDGGWGVGGGNVSSLGHRMAE